MAWLNIVAILLLANKGLITLKDFETQKRNGNHLSFSPEKLGIRNAGLWTSIRSNPVRDKPAIPIELPGVRKTYETETDSARPPD